MEVAGAVKADHLVEVFRGRFAEAKLRVWRPVKRAEVRVKGLFAPMAADVADAFAVAIGCDTGDVQTKALHMLSSGAGGTLWMRCPATAAKKAAWAGKVQVG